MLSNLNNWRKQWRNLLNRQWSKVTAVTILRNAMHPDARRKGIKGCNKCSRGPNRVKHLKTGQGINVVALGGSQLECFASCRPRSNVSKSYRLRSVQPHLCGKKWGYFLHFRRRCSYTCRLEGWFLKSSTRRF